MQASDNDGSPEIDLVSGSRFYFQDPSRSDFTIEDIAHGLSNTCRFVGQCLNFYSVAEHSIFVSNIAESFPLYGLLHDAAEAFLGDVPGPLKRLIPELKKLELSIQAAIFVRFGLRPECPIDIKRADLAVQAAEHAQVMHPRSISATTVSPANIVVQHLPPAIAKARFLKRFHEISDRTT